MRGLQWQQIDWEARWVRLDKHKATNLQRGRKTEVDLLNGEIVRLGAQLDVPTPINQRIVDLVKDAEHRGAAPAMAADELQRRVLHA